MTAPVTAECESAWHNYERPNDTKADIEVYSAFVAGWHAATEAAVSATLQNASATITVKYSEQPPEMIDGPALDFSAPSPLVGLVCEASLTGRTQSAPTPPKPSLCWICGQALPHDCVGSVQPTADRLDGLPDAQTTHGPPQKVELSTPIPGACILLYHEPAKRLAPPNAVTGRKWPIGTDEEYNHIYAMSHWSVRLRTCRQHTGLTLDALGAKLNPPRTRKDISAMEHGRRGLSVELCAQLADVLDCDRLWLAGWTLEGAS